jgi:hypothetical protein
MVGRGLASGHGPACVFSAETVRREDEAPLCGMRNEAATSGARPGISKAHSPADGPYRRG